MIVTCTMNPAIDIFIATNNYEPNKVNRTEQQIMIPNGKGINISFILKMREIDNTAIGFIGGFTGKFIKEELQKEGIETQFIEVDGKTRINIFTHVNSQKQQYNLVNPGPAVSDHQQELLLRKIELLSEDDILFVSGSTPKGISDDILIDISRIAQQRKINLILDSSSNIVLKCLEYKPYCLKPNGEELSKWFNIKDKTQKNFIRYGKKLIEMGAEKVLLTLGSKGSLYIDNKQVLKVNSPSGRVINTACAGDAFLATFFSEQLKGNNIESSLKIASAAGSSTACSEGLTDFADIEEIIDKISVKHIEGDVQR